MSNIGMVPGKVDVPRIEVDAAKAEQASEMKNLRKLRLQREVWADPSKASKLVKLEASPVYNAKGEIIQTAGSL